MPLERVLVVYDDLDLASGAVRLRAKGGHGGHNGMRSITTHFSGSKDFPRLRIGTVLHPYPLSVLESGFMKMPVQKHEPRDGHDGMRSITAHFSGSKDFPRLRIGAAPLSSQ